MARLLGSAPTRPGRLQPDDVGLGARAAPRPRRREAALVAERLEHGLARQIRTRGRLVLEWDELRVEAFLRETRHAEADEAPRNRMVVLAQLERLSGLSPSERSDPLHLLALERALQISAEALFDIGDHVPAGRGRAVPSRDRDVLPALAEAGIIPDAVATRLEGWASPRKLLVHGCADVGPGPPHPERGAGRVPGLDARSRGR